MYGCDVYGFEVYGGEVYGGEMYGCEVRGERVCPLGAVAVGQQVNPTTLKSVYTCTLNRVPYTPNLSSNPVDDPAGQLNT